ncbi:acyl-CoA thioesterase [Nocardioides pacificus]
MRHLYECPLRWADLDMLNHVNNVTYVDYLQEARVDMLLTHAPQRPAEELAEALVVVRHEVHYRAPLKFRFAPVSIECWVTEIRAATFTMAYEVFDETAEGRRVYLRASTVLTPYLFEEERPRRLLAEEKEVLTGFLEDPPVGEAAGFGAVPRSDIGHYPLHVRFSDVDVYGHVNNVKYFEYFQEARIVLMDRLASGLGTEIAHMRMVVAQTDVEYRVPILFRPRPYDVWSAITHLGRTSMVIESEILDGETVAARARVVVVFFDPATERPTMPPESVRDVVTALIDG